MPTISTHFSSIPSWNATSDDFFYNYMQYLYDDGILLMFHHEYPKETK